MDIGKMIKEERERQSLSMSALARLSGVPQSSISEIESDKRQPSFDSVERIIAALGFQFSDFFTESTPELDPDLRRLLDAAKMLTPEKRKYLIKFIEPNMKDN